MRDIDFNNIRRMDGSLLLVFHELLRERRATTVAKRLGLSQSAISHALTRLREIFGDPLFVRKPHGLEPTRRALELGPRIDALIELAGETLERETRFDPAQSKRMFVFSAPEFVNALIGARLVEAFRKTAPKARFLIETLPEAVAFQALKRGEIDLALGRFGPLPSGLRAEVLYEDRFCAVVRKGHPKVKGTLSQAVYAEIGHVYASATTEITVAERKAETKDIAMRASVPRWLTALVMVSASDAIATVPLRLAERQAKTMNLQVFKPSFLRDRITVSSVRREGTKDAGADWFYEQVKAAVR